MDELLDPMDAAATDDEDGSAGEGKAGRARRATAKKVNYAKEQEFSDADLFEDSDEAPQPARRSRPRPRRKKQQQRTASPPPMSGYGGAVADDDDVGGGGGDIYYRPVYSERGYDPDLLPIRERFPFLPEYEEDGSPKIELIVGRRLVDENDDAPDGEGGDDDDEEKKESGDEDEELAGGRTRRRRSSSPKKKKKAAALPGSPDAAATGGNGPGEYEYLVKYKGRSYLHLEWKTGADLESMNKSAKGIFRRYVKKVAAGVDDDLENPEFDPSFAVPEKILDEADQEIQVELTDKELLRWEKQREKELAEEDEEDEDEDEGDKKSSAKSEKDSAEKSSGTEPHPGDEEKKGAFFGQYFVLRS